jgi:hypothetical protein
MRSLRLGVLCALVCGAPVDATTVMRFDLAELTQNAACIFVGQCQQATTELVDGLVYTRYRFAVDQVVHGEPVRQIVVHLRGGQYQDRQYVLAGMPRFVPGERVVLFLTDNDPRGYAWPVGLGQGVFRIQQVRGEARVFQPLGEGAQYVSPVGVAAKPVPIPSPGGQSLQSFLQRVRSHLPSESARNGDR